MCKVLSREISLYQLKFPFNETVFSVVIIIPFSHECTPPSIPHMETSNEIRCGHKFLSLTSGLLRQHREYKYRTPFSKFLDYFV